MKISQFNHTIINNIDNISSYDIWDGFEKKMRILNIQLETKIVNVKNKLKLNNK